MSLGVGVRARTALPFLSLEYFRGKGREASGGGCPGQSGQSEIGPQPFRMFWHRLFGVLPSQASVMRGSVGLGREQESGGPVSGPVCLPMADAGVLLCASHGIKRLL